ncbi:MAG: Ppx/GppA phosphatase family protein [Acidimicrobiales bacterium]
MRIAALDLGSNSFHMLVARLLPGRGFEVLAKEKETLRLGEAVARTGEVGVELSDRAVQVVRRMRSLAENMGVDELVALGTAALREAEDGPYLVDRFRDEAGVEVQVIGGRREAQLVFRAVRSAVLLDPSPALALDLGGGSLEIMVGDQQRLIWATSVRLGVARLTAEFVTSDPPSAHDVEALTMAVEAALSPLGAVIDELGPKMLVGSSGTLCALGRMASALETGVSPASVNQLTVSGDNLGEVRRLMLTEPLARRSRIEGMDARRADLAPAGSILLAWVMERFGFDDLVLSDWALREGIVLDAIGRHDPADLGEDPRAIRMAAVLGLCRRCNWPEAHSRQVAWLALALFDAVGPALGLGPVERELLELGCLLHDIGEHVSPEGHERHTAYLIKNAGLRGFSPEEVALLVTLGRFHRRGTPKPDQEPFDALAESSRMPALRLLAILRVADALDRSHNQVIRALDAGGGEEGFRLVIRADEEIDLEMWALRRKGKLWEQVMGGPLVVEVG